MIRTVLVDDEPPARRKLHHLLAHERDIEVVAEAESAGQAIDVLNRLQPDLVFLDIGLPDASGFEVVEALNAKESLQIVFVTAFDEFALKAFDVHALDYLLKPVEPSRFAKALDRIRAVNSSREPRTTRLNELVAGLHLGHPYARRLLIQQDNRSLFVQVERIDWIESARNYACIHVGAQTFIQRISLDALVAKLDPARFYRVNRAQIVNVNRIAEVRPGLHGDARIILRDATEMTWSRRYRLTPLQKLERL